MAEIPRKLLDELSEEINALSKEGKQMIANVLENAEWSDVAELREIAIEAMEMVCSSMTDMAAARTAEFYDEAREIAVGEALGAEALSGRNPQATEKAVRALIQSVVNTGTTDQFRKELINRVDYEIKRASRECVSLNGGKDPLKPKYALVPAGGETCKVCIAIAANGFIYDKNSAVGHVHSNCDCRFTPGFGERPSVEGYDPEELYYRQKGMDEFFIPKPKLTNYALDPTNSKSSGKPTAFEKALGITAKDADYLMTAVYTEAGKTKPIYKDENEWGKRYYHDMVIKGLNGKTAKVKVGWIKDTDDGKMRMTTIYVDK